ncbi:hypothetical protein DL98DRAFT_615220 [Cadophora sp. DSE1049]|nr:hypothetical protein DL98DRAFT_615220 [Cadophora sp. DSE1049]
MASSDMGRGRRRSQRSHHGSRSNTAQEASEETDRLRTRFENLTTKAQIAACSDYLCSLLDTPEDRQKSDACNKFIARLSEEAKAVYRDEDWLYRIMGEVSAFFFRGQAPVPDTVLALSSAAMHWMFLSAEGDLSGLPYYDAMKNENRNHGPHESNIAPGFSPSAPPQHPQPSTPGRSSLPGSLEAELNRRLQILERELKEARRAADDARRVFRVTGNTMIGGFDKQYKSGFNEELKTLFFFLHENIRDTRKDCTVESVEALARRIGDWGQENRVKLEMDHLIPLRNEAEKLELVRAVQRQLDIMP